MPYMRAGIFEYRGRNVGIERLVFDQHTRMPSRFMRRSLSFFSGRALAPS